jgi:multimeric flavodoxin WrbA
VSARVLCIAGSPRRRGNSERLLDAFAGGVEAAGAEAVRLAAAQVGISPCLGCNACSKDGRCIQRDGMDEVYPLLESADAIVVASPVYFAGVPATLKALYDRCQPFWARRYILGQPARSPKRPGALLVVGGGGDPFGSDCVVTLTSSVFAVLGVHLEESMRVIGPDAPADIAALPEELERAAEMGGRIAKMATGGSSNG